MSSESNIFRQFLIEGYENREIKLVDVVDMKRKEFTALLGKAYINLHEKLYADAAKDYFAAMNLVKNDAYPDELKLSTDMVYSIKCCFCYSGLMDPHRFDDDNLSGVLLDVVKELSDNYGKRLFPMYLNVLVNFHRKDWLTTLTWCNEVGKYTDDEGDLTPTEECLMDLLPGSAAIQKEVETCQEIAFFGYGEKVTKNALLKPSLEKYKSCLYKLNDVTANKIASSASELELHQLFHDNILPLWCTANGTDPDSCYSEQFVNKCLRCKNTKSRTSPSKDQKLMEIADVEKCEESNKKSSCTIETNVSRWKVNTLSGNVGNAHKKKVKESTTMKKSSSIVTQTDKVKVCHKSVQTEGVKSKHVEVQVNNNDSQVLSALMDIKNKCLAMQEKKEEANAKLTKRINELQDRLNKETNAKKAAEVEFKKKCANFKFEIQQLKEQLGEHEQKSKTESEKNISLQKSLVELISDKYNLLKQQYKWYEKQAGFMVTYLSDMSKYLTVKSIPDVRSCSEHVEVWERHVQRIRRASECLNEFYDNARSNMIHSDVFSLKWPEITEFPSLKDNIIFLSFKPAILNIVQTEEKLYWSYAKDCHTAQALAQRAQTLAGLPLTVQYPNAQQFPAQNHVYMPIVVPSAATSLPLARSLYQQQLQQPQQGVKRDRRDVGGTVAPNASGSQSSKLNKSMECLSPVVKQESGASAVNNERDMILLDYVMEQCHGAKEEEVTLALLNLLEENKGTLSNIPREKIVEDVKVILRMKKQAAWVTPKSPHLDWHNDHSESNCTICFEEFTLQDKYTLPCQHEYHKECIKKWLKTNSVCPICRIHCVIEEDFPPLH